MQSCDCLVSTDMDIKNADEKEHSLYFFIEKQIRTKKDKSRRKTNTV